MNLFVDPLALFPTMVVTMSYKMPSDVFENNRENKEAESGVYLWLFSVDSWVSKKRRYK